MRHSNQPRLVRTLALALAVGLVSASGPFAGEADAQKLRSRVTNPVKKQLKRGERALRRAGRAVGNRLGRGSRQARLNEYSSGAEARGARNARNSGRIRGLAKAIHKRTTGRLARLIPGRGKKEGGFVFGEGRRRSSLREARQSARNGNFEKAAEKLREAQPGEGQSVGLRQRFRLWRTKRAVRNEAIRRLNTFAKNKDIKNTRNAIEGVRELLKLDVWKTRRVLGSRSKKKLAKAEKRSVAQFLDGAKQASKMGGRWGKNPLGWIGEALTRGKTEPDHGDFERALELLDFATEIRGPNDPAVSKASRTIVNNALKSMKWALKSGNEAHGGKPQMPGLAVQNAQFALQAARGPKGYKAAMDVASKLINAAKKDAKLPGEQMREVAAIAMHKAKQLREKHEITPRKRGILNRKTREEKLSGQLPAQMQELSAEMQRITEQFGGEIGPSQIVNLMLQSRAPQGGQSAGMAGAGGVSVGQRNTALGMGQDVAQDMYFGGGAVAGGDNGGGATE